jgi:hypothetical protein
MIRDDSLFFEERKKFLFESKICGGPAEYSYFGAISCPACRTFFKRNAEQGQVNKNYSILFLFRNS